MTAVTLGVTPPHANPMALTARKADRERERVPDRGRRLQVATYRPDLVVIGLSVLNIGVLIALVVVILSA